jgi:hypothetical protein
MSESSLNEPLRSKTNASDLAAPDDAGRRDADECRGSLLIYAPTIAAARGIEDLPHRSRVEI